MSRAEASSTRDVTTSEARSQVLDSDVPTVKQIMVHVISVTTVEMDIKYLRGTELHMQAPLKQNFECILLKSADAQDQPIGKRERNRQLVQ